MQSVWRIELLGGIRATRNGRELTRFRTQKTGSLLAFLAYHAPGSNGAHAPVDHPRELLLERLWPDDRYDSARHKLNCAVSALRRELEPAGMAPGSVLVTTRLTVGLKPGSVVTDVSDFEAALKQARLAREPGERRRCLAAAEALYRGELLPGAFEEWVPAEQARLQEELVRALRELAACCEAAGDLAGALRCAARAARIDPLREEAHRDLIRLHLAADSPGEAVRQYRLLERALKEELGTAPSAATRALMEAPIGLTGREAQLARPPSGQVGNGARSESLRASGASQSAPRAPYSALDAEPIGGAVPLRSPYYVERAIDREFLEAIELQDSIVLVKGPRQSGKTSLLVRGLDTARRAGARVALTDLDALNGSDLSSAGSLMAALAQSLAEQLELEGTPGEWPAGRSPSLNLRTFMRRQVLPAPDRPLVWALDEVDRLFTCPFGMELFGLFRSWHNERALEPDGPWSRLTLAIAYATEAHLFITDMNRSPFNVGTRLALPDFTRAQMEELNERYGGPLRTDAERQGFFDLLGGHPYLVRRALQEIARRGITGGELATAAGRDDWIFGDHLRRMRGALQRDPVLEAVMRELLAGVPCTDTEAFFRLRSAGVIVGDAPSDARPRCGLYASHLRSRLP